MRTPLSVSAAARPGNGARIPVGHRPAVLLSVGGRADAWSMSSAPRTTVIPDAELPRLLGLIGDADTVELKVTVPDHDRRSTVQALGMDPIDAEIRQVFFFDTPELDLYEHGVVVRARRSRGKGDTVVKLRPVVPAELPGALRRLRDFGVEVDAMPGSYVCSASLKGTADVQAVKEAAAGERPLRKLYSKQQRAFYRAHAPDGLELDALTALGPILVLKLKFTPEAFSRRMVAELWLYPDDSRILELSTKCGPAEAFQTAAETRAFLSERGVDLEGEQAPKTRRALEFFSSRTRPSAPRG